MVHRAVLGSVERMIAILTEHFAGKWPFFLSPRQVMVVPVTKHFTDYAIKVRDQIHGDLSIQAEPNSSAYLLGVLIV